MKYLFGLLLMWTQLFANSQTIQLGVIGKWKLLSLSDRDVYYNFKTDSAVLKNIAPTNKQDTTLGIQTLRQAMSIMKNTYYKFGNNGLLEIIRQDSIQKANYKIEPINNKMKLSYSRIGDSIIDEFYVTVSNSFLFLKSANDSEFGLVFEKE